MAERNAPLAARLLTWGLGGKANGPLRPSNGPHRPSNGPHRPSACHDRACPRPLCQVYREGREDGFAEGYLAGAAAAQDPG